MSVRSGTDLANVQFFWNGPADLTLFRYLGDELPTQNDPNTKRMGVHMKRMTTAGTEASSLVMITAASAFGQEQTQDNNDGKILGLIAITLTWAAALPVG